MLLAESTPSPWEAGGEKGPTKALGFHPKRSGKPLQCGRHGAGGRSDLHFEKITLAAVWRRN